jgi:hypothetical protein
MNLTKSSQSKISWLYNPFHYWGGSKLFFFGLLVIIIHIPIGYYFDVRFDGALDMHVVKSVDSLLVVSSDVFIAWVSTFVCLYLSALIFKSPIRLIDIAGATAVARVPLLIAIIPAKIFSPDIKSIEELLILQGSEFYLLLVGGFIVLLFSIWFILLLFNAYKINSNLDGWKLWTGFITSMIIAEAISLFVIRFV